MTVEQMMKAIGASTIDVYPAKNQDGTRKYDGEGNPLYKFLAYDSQGNKIDNGYVSKALGAKLEKGEKPTNVEAQLVEAEEPYYMLYETSLLTRFTL